MDSWNVIRLRLENTERCIYLYIVCSVVCWPVGAVAVVRGPVIFNLAAGAVEATARVFPARLISLRQLLMIHTLALFIRVRHQINVAVRVALETHQHHTWTTQHSQVNYWQLLCAKEQITHRDSNLDYSFFGLGRVWTKWLFQRWFSINKHLLIY